VSLHAFQGEEEEEEEEEEDSPQLDDCLAVLWLLLSFSSDLPVPP